MKKLSFLVALSFLIVCCVYIYKYAEPVEEEDNPIIEKLNAQTEKYVKVTSITNLYKKVEDNYIVIGSLNKDTTLNLEDTIVDDSTLYLKLYNEDYYIDLNNIEVTSYTEDKRYNEYIIFNQNIITNDTFKMYDENNNFISINELLSFPIIIKETDKYYIEFNNKLYYIYESDIKNIIETTNTEASSRNDIRTLAYHFIYKDGDECTNDYICETVDAFDEQMKYLADNNYFTLTMEELEMFLDGNIRIPLNSIVITLDDGYLGANAIEVLEKYKLNATYFVITKWNDLEKLKSDYVELASHTDDMHNNYVCSGGTQGGEILCADVDKIIADLTASKEKLDDTKYFCFPFYDYNDRAINILKDLGFTMAFVGSENTMGIANTSTNRYKIPRLTINSTVTTNEFIGLVNYN
ncbi:MAG: polysaccharide deacetylase family protein [Bacilli bacterium]|nr:polysaccharide deacetylase family protein [Bacilli bacterium]